MSHTRIHRTYNRDKEPRGWVIETIVIKTDPNKIQPDEIIISTGQHDVSIDELVEFYNTIMRLALRE